MKGIVDVQEKKISPSEDTIAMMTQRKQVPATGEYDKVKSNPSSMGDPSAHVLKYKSYLLSMPVVLTLKYILGLSIFVFVGNKERKNGGLNVVYFSIFSWIEKWSHTIYNWEDSWLYLQYDLIL